MSDPTYDDAVRAINYVTAERDALIRWTFGPRKSLDIWITTNASGMQNWYNNEAEALANVAATVRQILAKMEVADAD